ncbi:MAG: ComEA family DNA-binding protein [Adhaeribacter sp.]
MAKLRFWINRYFGFSRRETNGFFLLLLITLLAALAPFLWPAQAPPGDLSQDQAGLDSLVARLDSLSASRPRYGTARPAPGRRLPLKPFNPNTLAPEEWRQLGLSAYAAANVVKYRERAGGFRYKEQLARIYGLPPQLYRELEPYIDLPARPRKQPAAKAYAAAPRRYRKAPPIRPGRGRLQPFDINTADTSQLKRIRGIGPVLSGRIVRFRDKLGGFAQLSQLAEVYALPPEVVDSLHKYVFIRPGFSPQQIALNTASLQQLQAHPYLGFRLARLIVAYRSQHGPFQRLEDLGRIHQFPAAQLEKVRPYLRL